MKGITQEKINWARKILGLDDIATYKEVMLTWRTSIKKMHPDKGGDNDKTREITEAKDILVKFIENCPCRLILEDKSDWWNRRFGRLWEED
ncbi:MAG: hypothetical protein U9P49_05365 [Thermodesulfobacteriota bacterium]|nr:hypothetical protein [Thermodesulfobacteriota bacterium]